MSITTREALQSDIPAIAEGKARIDLSTAKTNKPAQMLYESLGWIRDEVYLVYNRRVGQPENRGES